MERVQALVGVAAWQLLQNGKDGSGYTAWWSVAKVCGYKASDKDGCSANTWVTVTQFQQQQDDCCQVWPLGPRMMPIAEVTALPPLSCKIKSW